MESLLRKLNEINKFALQRQKDKVAIGVSDLNRIEDQRKEQIREACKEYCNEDRYYMIIEILASITAMDFIAKLLKETEEEISKIRSEGVPF